MVTKKTSKKIVKSESTNSTEPKDLARRDYSNLQKFNRDEYGLLPSIEYIFDKDGFIDWRSMIPKEYLFPNRYWFELKGKEVPKSVDGLDDEQILIRLSGIKWAARIRGY